MDQPKNLEPEYTGHDYDDSRDPVHLGDALEETLPDILSRSEDFQDPEVAARALVKELTDAVARGNDHLREELKRAQVAWESLRTKE